MKKETTNNMLDFNRDGKIDRNDVKYYIAYILIITGVGMLISGFWVSPVGILDSSVITTFGMILAFVGSILGIDAHYNYMFNKYKKEFNPK